MLQRPEQLRECHTERVAHVRQRFHGRIRHTSLNGGNVGPVYMGIEGQRFLGFVSRMAAFLDPFAQGGTDGRWISMLRDRVFDGHDYQNAWS
jgi:hypothetical protein